MEFLLPLMIRDTRKKEKKKETAKPHLQTADTLGYPIFLEFEAAALPMHHPAWGLLINSKKNTFMELQKEEGNTDM
ncbi:hypothetical protein NC653_015152 [Populus alba x Populus x berolinensis]|uniref:Uncharacterized protein n=1 Tax=Populus alba x Populus x berolinensis TaxID=444605 RepID=A0AAD6QYU8_9ROSI|nr:hypothetical protein NC653_015152 [Populus alba x Populus x berolinensis]